MKTKLQTLKDAAALGDWQRAISIAAKFPRLGEFKEDITRAHTAFTNPRFLSQIGRDVNCCIEAGKSALIAAYSLDTIKH